jgi:ABC-type nickel/cobalt efflux system permease component RcnA
MTSRHKHLALAVVVLAITIICCIATALYFPPASAGVAIVGSAIIGWCVNKTLDKVSEDLETEPPPKVSKETQEETLNKHAHTIHHHYSETAIDGHHTSHDVRETIVEDDPPDRPRKPGLSQ